MAQGQTTYSQKNIWDKIWRDPQGNIVIFQMPNLWLIAWAVLTVIYLFMTGKPANVIGYIAEAALAIWALLEIFRGVNYFRRGLGVVVLIFTIMSLLKR